MDGQHTHSHGGGGMDPTPVVLAGIIGIVAIVVLPIVLAILQVLFYILLTVAGIGVVALVYRLQHKVDPPAFGPVKRFTELPKARRQELPPHTTHVTLTKEQYENLVRRIDRG